MLTPYDHVLAAFLAVLFPLRARSLMQGRLAQATEAELPSVRLGAYRGAIAVQWTLATATAALWIFTRRPWFELGVIPIWNGGMIGILVGIAVVVGLVLRQRGGAGRIDDRSAEALRKRVAKFERVMPRTPRDLGWFYALSLTAGICEEVLYRGYMIWYLQRLGLALLPAAAVSSLIFGIGHLYQGARGILLTTLVGVFLAGVYLLSGSLLAGMVIHALMDMHSGSTLYAAYAQESSPTPAAEAAV